MISLPFLALLASIAAVPALITALGSNDDLLKRTFGNVLRTAAIFTITIGLLVMGGAQIGIWLKGVFQDDARWIADVFWFVVGLKMILSARKNVRQTGDVDMDQVFSVFLLGFANGLNAMLITITLGLISENTKLFSVYVALFVFLFSLAGFLLPVRFPGLGKWGIWLYPVMGSILILMTLVIF